MPTKQPQEGSSVDELVSFWISNYEKQALIGSPCMSLTWSSVDRPITVDLSELSSKPVVSIWRERWNLSTHATFSSWETLHSRLLQERAVSQSTGESHWSSRILPIEARGSWQRFIQLMCSETPDRIAFSPKTLDALLDSSEESFRLCPCGLLWSTPSTVSDIFATVLDPQE